MLFEFLHSRPFCIYGAGIVACSIYTAIKTLYHKSPLFFLVSDSMERGGTLDQTPIEIDGIAVKSLSMWERELQIDMSGSNIPAYYLIAVPEAHHFAVTDSLRSMETVQIEDSQLVLFTNELENQLMEAYYRSLPECVTMLSILTKRRSQEIREEDCRRGNHLGFSEARREIIGQEISSVQVYQAKSHIDKPIHNRSAESDSRLEYLHPIQAGAALTDCRIAGLQDNQGDNISAKNYNYCELTATYYTWKHSRAACKGICHYRRIFDISEEQMQNLLQVQQEWDVILPYPSIHYPNISAQHSRYVKEGDWDAMLRALEEVEPEYLEAYKKSVAAGEQFFHNFNMLIAKAPVFDDYCDFLFRVLERTEELTTPKGWERADRFAGYLGENLTTIYFLKNRGKWKIAYAGKIWLT